MGSKIRQFTLKAMALFFIQVFLLVNTACADLMDSGDVSSCLSPVVNISGNEFAKSFDAYSALFSDTISLRKSFKNDLYELPFKVLFPQIVQYHLLSSINSDLLSGVDRSEISGIDVEYVSDDDVYDLFQKHGESKLGALIGNDKIKWAVHPFTETRQGRRYFDFVGLNWATKRASAKTKDQRQRKYLIDSIRGCADYKLKELRSLPTGVLWKIYWQDRLPYIFGQNLLNDQNLEFKVSVKLVGGTELEGYINIKTKTGVTTKGRNISCDVSFEQTKGIPARAEALPVKVDGIPQVSFGSKIEKIEDDAFRQQMHILESQVKDLSDVVKAIDELVNLKEVSLTDWQNGVSAENLDLVKERLTEIDKWLSKSPKVYKGQIQKKAQAHKKLEQIVKKWGYLSRANLAGTVENIDAAVELLQQRVKELYKGISKRNVQLFVYANDVEDSFLLVQVLRVQTALIDIAIRTDSFSAALEMIEFLEAEYLANDYTQSILDQYAFVKAELSQLKKTVENAAYGKQMLDTVWLIDEVEYSKQQMFALTGDLAKTQKWLEDRKFTQFATQVRKVIGHLEKANAPGKNYLKGLNSASIELDKLMKNVDAAKGKKLNPGIKKVIHGRFLVPRLSLQDMLRKTFARNNALKKHLPNTALSTTELAKLLLRTKFQETTGFKTYSALKINTLNRSKAVKNTLAQIQRTHSVSDDFVLVGEVVPRLINKLSQPYLINQAI